MAQVTEAIALGAPTIRTDSTRRQLSWLHLRNIPPVSFALLADDRITTAGLQFFLIRLPGSGHASYEVNMTIVGTSRIPDLHEALERSNMAFRLYVAGLDNGPSVVIPGPTSDNVLPADRDTTEPYTWHLRLESATEAMDAFFTAVQGLSTVQRGAITLEASFDDGREQHEVYGGMQAHVRVTGQALRSRQNQIYGAQEVGLEIRGNMDHGATPSRAITTGSVANEKVIGMYVYRASNYQVDAGQEVNPPGESNNMFEWITSFRETLALDEVDTISIDVKRGSPWHLNDTIDYHDRIVVARDSTGNGVADVWRCYRVRNITTGTGDTASMRIEAWSIDQDLSDYLWAWQPGPEGAVSRTFDFVAYRLRDVLQELFTNDVLPDVFKLAYVDPTIADVEISPLVQDATIKEVLDTIRNELTLLDYTLEWEHVYDHATGDVSFSFLEERGRSEMELNAGQADPTLRVLAGPSGRLADDVGTRINASTENIQDDYVSRMIPRGGTAEEPVSIGGIAWDVVSRTYDSVLGRTALTLEDGAIQVIAQYTPSVGVPGRWAVRTAEGTYADIVVTTRTPPRIVVDDNVTTATVVFVESLGRSRYREVDYIREPTGEGEQGVVMRKEDFPDVSPYANLFEEQGGSGDMSSWPGSLPTGLQLHKNNADDPDAQVSPNVLRQYIAHGRRSARVECVKAGTGVKVDVVFASDALNPYASAYAVLQVERGRVRMYLEDAAGTLFPAANEPQHDGVAEVTQALALEGHEVAPGVTTIYIEGQDDDTVFYLDALSVTQSPTHWPYSPHMGAKALYVAAGGWMRLNGGVRPITSQVKYIDLRFVGETIEPLRVGSWVTYKDMYATNSRTWGLELVGRVERLENSDDGSPVDGGFLRMATIGRQRPSIVFGRGGFVRPTLPRRGITVPSVAPTGTIPLPAKCPATVTPSLTETKVTGIVTQPEGDSLIVRFEPTDSVGAVLWFLKPVNTGEVDLNRLPEEHQPEPPTNEEWDTALENGQYLNIVDPTEETPIHIMVEPELGITYVVFLLPVGEPIEETDSDVVLLDTGEVITATFINRRSFALSQIRLAFEASEIFISARATDDDRLELCAIIAANISGGSGLVDGVSLYGFLFGGSTTRLFGFLQPADEWDAGLGPSFDIETPDGGWVTRGLLDDFFIDRDTIKLSLRAWRGTSTNRQYIPNATATREFQSSTSWDAIREALLQVMVSSQDLTWAYARIHVYGDPPLTTELNAATVQFPWSDGGLVMQGSTYVLTDPLPVSTIRFTPPSAETAGRTALWGANCRLSSTDQRTDLRELNHFPEISIRGTDQWGNAIEWDRVFLTTSYEVYDVQADGSVQRIHT